MNLNQVTVAATDVARAIDFYAALGLKLIVKNLPSYARFECPDGESTFSVHQVERMTPSQTVVYFECDDVDAKFAALQRAGVAFTAPPVDQPWRWREAYLADPDGNTLCLFHAGADRRHPPWRLR
jgi:predicted enzyme related to lactoylglutathione lyase